MCHSLAFLVNPVALPPPSLCRQKHQAPPHLESFQVTPSQTAQNTAMGNKNPRPPTQQSHRNTKPEKTLQCCISAVKKELQGLNIRGLQVFLISLSKQTIILTSVQKNVIFNHKKCRNKYEQRGQKKKNDRFSTADKQCDTFY